MSDEDRREICAFQVHLYSDGSNKVQYRGIDTEVNASVLSRAYLPMLAWAVEVLSTQIRIVIGEAGYLESSTAAFEQITASAVDEEKGDD